MNYQAHDYHRASDELHNLRRLHPPRLRRWLVFLLVFLPCMAVSQIYIFLQPAIYRSVATVLTMAATDLDQASPSADIQHVSIQKQLLLGTAILEKTVERLQNMLTNDREWSTDELSAMFSVIPEPATNLVHLQAEGPEPKVLQRSVNAWIETYLQIRAAFVAENTEKVTAEIADQLQRIDRQVAEKRNEVDRFRLQHDILSTESADNQAHARLQGLNKSLNSALEEEVKAKAKLDTILAAISRNEVVVPEEDTRAMAVLLQQAEKLREELAAIEAHYTREYIDLNPNLGKVREQLVEIETKIAQKASVGKDFARQEAEHNYAAAREAVAAIRQQMQAHKQLAAEYTTQFTEHQALQQELLNLETLQQDTKQRLVDIEVKQREKYPQVDVVDWASLPDKPIRPDYLQESLLAFAASLALALLSVIIIDYLNREPAPQPVPMSLGGIHLHHQPRAMLDVAEPVSPQVGYDPLKALPIADDPIELTHQDVLTLTQAAEPSIKAIIHLLFNGLSLPEILTLSADCLNFDALMILIPGQRNVLMTESTADWFKQHAAFDNWPSEAEIATLLCCAAIDSGLPNPELITIETLRRSYLLFLVRQGIKLADLTKIAGPLSPEQLLELGRHAVPQANPALENINLDYFRATGQ